MGSSSTCCAPPRTLPPPSPLSAWRERLLDEVGRDPLAVTRDFPRTPLFVSTGARNNYCDAGDAPSAHSIFTSHTNSNANANVNSNSNSNANANVADALFAARAQRMAAAVGLLAELCRETGAAFALTAAAEGAAAADSSAELRAALLRCGMMREEERKEEEEEEGEREGEGEGEGEREKEGKGYGAVERQKRIFVVQSRALRVMQYMVQSVVFFAIRSVTTALPQDWCKHMLNVAWTVHVYGETDDVIVVQHKHVQQLHVEKHELYYTPKFEIDFTCSIRIHVDRLLRNTSAAPKIGNDEEVQSIETKVHAVRLLVPRYVTCWPSSLWVRRRDELALTLLKNFQVEIIEVSELPNR